MAPPTLLPGQMSCWNAWRASARVSMPKGMLLMQCSALKARLSCHATFASQPVNESYWKVQHILWNWNKPPDMKQFLPSFNMKQYTASCIWEHLINIRHDVHIHIFMPPLQFSMLIHCTWDLVSIHVLVDIEFPTNDSSHNVWCRLKVCIYRHCKKSQIECITSALSEECRTACCYFQVADPILASNIRDGKIDKGMRVVISQSHLHK